MKKMFSEPETIPFVSFSQAVREAIECAEKGQLIEHKRVWRLFRDLKIKTLRSMECPRRKN